MLEYYLNQVHKIEVKPRYSYQRKLKVLEGQETFELKDI